MTLKLYYAPGACSFVPHALLETAGVPFEPLLVKLHKQEQDSPAFRAVNPRGQVPVLVDDGEVITQILAIVDYLDAKFPAQEFLPRTPLARARALEVLAWMNNSVHPTFTHIFMPHKFTSDPQAQAEVRRHAVEVYRGLLAELEAMAGRAAEAGRGFLAGGRFGPLDAYALTLLRWGSLGGIDPTRYEALWTHVRQVAALPAVARVIERERLQLNLFRPA